MYTTKNYLEQSGERLVICGELDIAGGKMTSNGTQAPAIIDHDDPSTATLEDIATKQNQILAALRGVGIIAE